MWDDNRVEKEWPEVWDVFCGSEGHCHFDVLWNFQMLLRENHLLRPLQYSGFTREWYYYSISQEKAGIDLLNGLSSFCKSCTM
jgi:hypothetical protein